MSTNTYSLTWDIDVFFKGGSESPEFAAYIIEVTSLVERLERQVSMFTAPKSSDDTEELNDIISNIEVIGKKLSQASAFVSCLQAQDMADQKANLLRGTLTQLHAKFSTSLTKFHSELTKIEDSVWNTILESDEFKEISFVLNERRQKSSELLSVDQESLITALSVDGYHGWGQMYDTVVGKMQIEYDDKILSVGQASNLFSSKDRNVRKEIFEKWEETWGNESDYFAKILNHLAGFRLSVYGQRGWNNVLKEPLSINRMSQETLDSMWGAIIDNKAPFVEYLQRKAKLLGVEKLSWYDLDAPVADTDSAISYSEGAEFILDQFKQFGDELTDFTKMAFEDSWIEAEDRPGKRPGGFCTGFSESGQSRIFMTYSGTPSNVSTLAHELGHAFHSFAMKDVHTLNKHYAMNVAETASTFAEMIVADAAVKNANSDEERLALLEDKIQRSVAFYMNIHARFLFETRFYEERKNGVVSKNRINELMEEAQKEAYCGALDEYHPHFWSSKLHFYITGVPFYNFPYTFGYLFSLGIYAKALEEGKSYEQKYIALLKDTASMTVEELAQKHLGVDLTKRDFWEKAVKLSLKDVEEFLSIT
ncbi:MULTISPECIES: M3 family oligoendopeptidase [unclassified Bacillus (in: firmicutes)]|uniref:M3 family oligoendopeptidase n=1 Tax=unclassified Bacillus (in: firmicutes) TaxID=185979 RepID=UPI000BEF7FCA|nr:MULTISPECIES: M3 family oligoendopeptidase [unclassified Bacillus (in: firmicutes)]PEJ54503.1 oligoendopeptidase [Bacillus sp. AFS002410]PEL13374.1 oligoendopeptidase [Bacillus sp. AFS017336]